MCIENSRLCNPPPISSCLIEIYDVFMLPENQSLSTDPLKVVFSWLVANVDMLIL